MEEFPLRTQYTIDNFQLFRILNYAILYKMAKIETIFCLERSRMYRKKVS